MKGRTKLRIRFQKYSSNTKINDCPVSKASAELMLDRVCNGKSLEFPFSK